MPAPSYASDRTGPAWLKGALDAPFFTACPEHSTGGFSHKTDRNFYCLDCHEDALCTFCVDRSHRGHDILQIRRASHNNAVRVNEIHQVNAEGVQQYTINGSKILFLKGRRPPQPWRGGYHFCEICGRSLLDAMRFCSLACKVAAVQESTDPLLSMQPGMSSKDLSSEAKHVASKRDQKKVKREEKVKHSKRQFQLQREAAAAASKQEASWKAWREAAADDGEDKLREMIREVLDLVGFDEQASSKRKAEGEPEVVVIPKRRKRSNMGQPQVENRGSWEGAEKRDDGSSSSSVREEHASRSGGEHAGSSRFGLPSSSGRSYSQSDDDEATSIKWPGSGEGQARSGGTHSTDSGIALSSSGMQEPEEVSMKPKGYSEGLEPLKKQKQGMEGNSSDNEHSCLSEPHSPVSVLRQRSGNFGQRVAALPPAIASELDPSAAQDGPALPTRGSDEFKPFIRRLPEFKFWYAITKAFVVAFVMTFFSVFDVPVFWPILLCYWIVLFVLTMKRQILHMVKYKYVPFNIGKQKYGGKKGGASSSSSKD